MLLRIFPHPLLAATLTVVWVLLINSISPGSIVVGLIVATSVAKFTSIYWPDRPQVRHPLLVLEYLAIFFYDILMSNVEVARLILFRKSSSLKSQFVTVPLDLRTPEAIVALAATITLTPGTVSADVSDDRRSLLVHCIETNDPDATVAQIKERYERRLKRILE